MSQPSPCYTADMIEILEGLEPVRRRPRMYIGETDGTGLHQLVWAAVGHCLDRHFAGELDHLVVHVAGDDVSVAGGRSVVTVSDVAVGERNRTLASELETLYCGPGHSSAQAYEAVGDLSAFLPIITALSSQLVAEYLLPDGRHAHREYRRGILQRASEGRHEFGAADVALRFQPDPQIFEGAALDYDQIAERLQTVSFFNPHLRIDLRGGAPPDQTSTTFHHPDGLVAYLRRLVAGQTLQGEPRLHTYVEGTTRVDLALQLLQHTEQRIALAVNSCPCPVGHPLERIVSDALCEAGVGQPMDTTANHLSTSGAGAVAVVNLWLLDAWSVWHSGNTTRDDSAPIRRAITAAIRNAFT